jgi:hypothetical protein
LLRIEFRQRSLRVQVESKPPQLELVRHATSQVITLPQPSLRETPRPQLWSGLHDKATQWVVAKMMIEWDYEDDELAWIVEEAAIHTAVQYF